MLFAYLQGGSCEINFQKFSIIAHGLKILDINKDPIQNFA